MKTKTCSKCKLTKTVSEFRQYKTGRNSGYYFSYCIKCDAEYQYNRNKFMKQFPWYRTHRRILARCCATTGGHKKYYKDKGIKNFLSTNDLKNLWFRDKAYLLQRPSIDRIDSNKNYTIDNCRYIELYENIGRS